METILGGAILVAGLFLILSALYVEAHHVKIWNDYKKNYTKPSSSFMAVLSRPSKPVYQFNVYILWPLTFVVGCIAVGVAIMSFIG